MRPLEELSPAFAQGVTCVFTDIDDTLTAEGRLQQEAFAALWDLREAGFKVVPITGRPAGWCDLIARQWPVDAVIGENGALAYSLADQGRVERMYYPGLSPHGAQQKLAPIRDAILREVPRARVASDQAFRLFDLAIDYCEEEPKLTHKDASKIAEVFERMGATAKISSIHVNGWFGNHNKLAMAKHFAQARWGWDEEQLRSQGTFVGDSPNDEPMFAFFAASFGVANVSAFAQHMKALPTYVATQSGGLGFREVADAILRVRD